MALSVWIPHTVCIQSKRNKDRQNSTRNEIHFSHISHFLLFTSPFLTLFLWSSIFYFYVSLRRFFFFLSISSVWLGRRQGYNNTPYFCYSYITVGWLYSSATTLEIYPVLGEEVARAAVFPHLCMLSYMQMQCYSPLQQLHSAFMAFNKRVCQVMKNTVAESNPDTELLNTTNVSL